MEILFGILIFFSSPILYILGIIFLIKLVTSSANNPSRKTLLRQIIAELEEKVAANPRTSAKALLQTYQEEYNALTAAPPQQHTQPAKTPDQAPALHPTPSLSNWYSDNSVNLLLYIGAFLIVASAFTFVRFQWEAIDGITKGVLITLMAAGFLASGIKFFTISKIRQAGVTFSIIGALLIPFCGWAWHAFYLADAGIDGGMVWLVTSLISIAVYEALTIRLQSHAFSYLTSLTVFSAVASLVSVGDLSGQYYVLSAMASALILQAIRLVWLRYEKAKPLFDISTVRVADMLAVLSLGYGLMLAIMAGNLFTVEAVLLLATGVLYFFTSYLQFKQAPYLAALELTIPVFVTTLFGWQGAAEEITYYTLTLIVLGYVGIAFGYAKGWLPDHRKVHLHIALLLSNVLFITALIQLLDVADLAKLSFTPIVVGLAIVYLRKQTGYLLVSAIYTLIFCYYFIIEVMGLPALPYLAFSYWTLGIMAYTLTLYAKQYPSLMRSLACVTTMFFFGNWLVSLDDSTYLLITSGSIATILGFAAVQLGNNRFIYGSNLALTYFVLILNRQLVLDPMLHPLMFAALFAGMYAFAYIARPATRPLYVRSAILGLLATPIVYMGVAEPTALVALYGAFAIVLVDAYLTKNTNRAYLASTIGMVVYLWQIQYLGVTELQAYTLPLALYFLALGWLQSKAAHVEKRDLLYLIALVFFITPTALQTADTNGAVYALVLGLYGISLMLLGNTLVYKRFRLGGSLAVIIAVFSQLYEYALSLPRWAIIGGVGMLLLAVALVILIKRREQ